MNENKITYAEYTEQLHAKAANPQGIAPDVLRVDIETVPVEKQGLFKLIQDQERAKRQYWQSTRKF